MSPTGVLEREWVTAPTSRIVCCSGKFPPEALLTEMGTSPTPKADSIVNWPGVNPSRTPSAGSSFIVNVSGVSWRLPGGVMLNESLHRRPRDRRLHHWRSADARRHFPGRWLLVRWLGRW